MNLCLRFASFCGECFQGPQGVVGGRGEKGPRGSVGEAGVQGSSGATGRPGQAVSHLFFIRDRSFLWKTKCSVSEIYHNLPLVLNVGNFLFGSID